jgi:tRNA (guanine-N7-)-methyltransferase
VAAVHLFFPDPWPKARHAKRRFISAHTLDLIADRLVDGGRLLVATDHDTYAAHACAELADHPEFDVAPAARPGWRPTEGFEAKGIAAGRAVTDLRAVGRHSGGRRTG